MYKFIVTMWKMRKISLNELEVICKKYDLPFEEIKKIKQEDKQDD